MADYSKTSPNESQRLVIQRMLDSMDIAKPCIIKEVKPGPPLKVTVQPTERMKITIGQETKYMALPEINDVPVILPCAQTAGFLLTLPLKPGDTGLLIVADKDITNFVASGNINDPPVGSDPDVSNVRKRSLTDVIFIPGLSSDQVAIQSYNTENIEHKGLDPTSSQLRAMAHDDRRTGGLFDERWIRNNYGSRYSCHPSRWSNIHEHKLHLHHFKLQHGAQRIGQHDSGKHYSAGRHVH